MDIMRRRLITAGAAATAMPVFLSTKVTAREPNGTIRAKVTMFSLDELEKVMLATTKENMLRNAYLIVKSKREIIADYQKNIDDGNDRDGLYAELVEDHKEALRENLRLIENPSYLDKMAREHCGNRVIRLDDLKQAIIQA